MPFHMHRKIAKNHINGSATLSSIQSAPSVDELFQQR